MLSMPQGWGQTPARPFVQRVSGTRATVRWQGTERLRLWEPNGAVREIQGRRIGPRFEAVLGELTPGTEYRYQAGEQVHSFRTAGPGRLPFVVIGDTGTGSAEQSALAQRLAQEDVRLLLHTGDVAYPVGNTEAYERRYLDFYHAMMPRVPFYPCPGNHDYYETGAAPYFALHDLPHEGVDDAERGRYYSFDWGDATFLSLDTNDPLQDPLRRARMLDWLDGTLARSSRFWRIVYFHHPPYASGPNEDDPLTALAREHIVPILTRHRVPVVFNGHEHSYQRSTPMAGTVYYTSGGGGAALYPVGNGPQVAHGESAFHYLSSVVNDYRLQVEAIGLDGRAFDASSVRPLPSIRDGGAVNAASFEARIGRGSPISLFGWHLALAGRNDVTVEANGRTLPLLAAAANQVNISLPADLTGRVALRLTTPNGSASVEIDVLEFGPALFERQPMERGAIYATGLLDYSDSVLVEVNGQPRTGRVEPGPAPGVQRIAFEPLPAGEHAVRVVAGGMASNTIRLSNP